jgi:hypothetical protein
MTMLKANSSVNIFKTTHGRQLLDAFLKNLPLIAVVFYFSLVPFAIQSINILCAFLLVNDFSSDIGSYTSLHNVYGR